MKPPCFYSEGCIYSNMGKWKSSEASLNLLLLSSLYSQSYTKARRLHHSSTCLGTKLVSSCMVVLNILVSRIGYIYHKPSKNIII